MKIELVPKIQGMAGAAGLVTSWTWRMRAPNGTEWCSAPTPYPTADDAEKAVDELMQQIRGVVDVVRLDPAQHAWTETVIATYQAEGVLSHGEDASPA